MSKTPHTAEQTHTDVCECAACIHISPTPAQEDQSESIAARAEVGQGKGTQLPVDVPESDTLWLFLTKGYSLNFIRYGLASGDPMLEQEAQILRERAQRAWKQIRSEVGA